MTPLRTMIMSVALLVLFSLSLATQKILVLFGPSQAGKSSFINSLSGYYRAVEGTGEGISQTTKCEEYLIEGENGNVVILDVPGLGDNYDNTTDDEIMDNIRDTVMNHLKAMLLETTDVRETVDGILIFEPLDNDYSQLKQTLSKVQLLFGPSVFESSLVVFTKGDLDYARREDVDSPIPTCSWQSYGVDAEQHRANWNNMSVKLAELKPFRVNKMNEVMEEIEILAARSCENQPETFITVKVPVTRQVQTGTKSYSVLKEKPPVQKFKTESYKVQEQVLVTKARTFAELQKEFVNLYLLRHSYNARTEMAASPLWMKYITQEAGYCAQVYMQDITKKDGRQLYLDFTKTAPNYTTERYIVWEGLVCIDDTRSIGCGVDVYRTETVKKERQVPYTHIERYYETVKEPVFSTVQEIEEKHKLAPKRPVSEFITEARETIAKRIRDGLQ